MALLQGSLSLLQWIFPTQESNWGLRCIAGGFFIFGKEICILTAREKSQPILISRAQLAVPLPLPSRTQARPEGAPRPDGASRPACWALSAPPRALAHAGPARPTRIKQGQPGLPPRAFPHMVCPSPPSRALAPQRRPQCAPGPFLGVLSDCFSPPTAGGWLSYYCPLFWG